ncbi:MAG: hypothetical protein RMK52_10090 [Chitinophagales bacterium]|nr:hypothetical protein [Chitinophagales bacterium]
MNFQHLVTSATGLIHLLASVLAVVAGTFILALPKGTRLHRRIGRVYAVSMVAVLITAFLIYRLFDGWGMFHWAALAATLTLLGGMIPILTRWPRPHYVVWHFCFMYWSVIGLYGALASEIAVRIPSVVMESGIPNRTFYMMAGIGTALVMLVGAWFFIKMLPRWSRQFAPSG